MLSTLLLACSLYATPVPADSFTVYFFLLEDCMITQAYTDRIGELYTEYGRDSIGFIALFPNPVSTDSSAGAFAQKYEIPFTTTRGRAVELARQFEISVTPEVVVYNETRKVVVYQGRIDNLYERIGQCRQVVTSHELAAALFSIRHFKPVPVPRTTAVGCFLSLK